MEKVAVDRDTPAQPSPSNKPASKKTTKNTRKPHTNHMEKVAVD